MKVMAVRLSGCGIQHVACCATNVVLPNARFFFPCVYYILNYLHFFFFVLVYLPWKLGWAEI